MLKKYNSPKTECASFIKSSILCASNDGEGALTGGGNKDNEPNAAPGRKLF